jgi:hypothetical protein
MRLFAIITSFQKKCARSYPTVERTKKRMKSTVLKMVGPVVEDTTKRIKSESLEECRSERSTNLLI